MLPNNNLDCTADFFCCRLSYRIKHEIQFLGPTVDAILPVQWQLSILSARFPPSMVLALNPRTLNP